MVYIQKVVLLNILKKHKYILYLRGIFSAFLNILGYILVFLNRKFMAEIIHRLRNC